jgi:hypothetical protein
MSRSNKSSPSPSGFPNIGFLKLFWVYVRIFSFNDAVSN